MCVWINISLKLLFQCKFPNKKKKTYLYCFKVIFSNIINDRSLKFKINIEV